MGEKLPTREVVMRLYDELHNGLKFDRKTGTYTLVWTARQIRNARRRARRLYKTLRIKPLAP